MRFKLDDYSPPPRSTSFVPGQLNRGIFALNSSRPSQTEIQPPSDEPGGMDWYTGGKRRRRTHKKRRQYRR